MSKLDPQSSTIRKTRVTRKKLQSWLEAAAGDLVYSSESDRPFEWFFLKRGATGWPYDTAEFAKRFPEASGKKLEERSLDDFFRRHIETSDPYDVRAQQIRPRYEALKALIESSLKNPKVIRIGSIEVRCLIVGDDGHGNLAGFSTVAIET